VYVSFCIFLFALHRAAFAIHLLSFAVGLLFVLKAYFLIFSSNNILKIYILIIFVSETRLDYFL